MAAFHLLQILTIFIGIQMNRYLVRHKEYERREPHKDARKLYIYCEGEKREYEYFKFFRGLSMNIDVIPIPSENGMSDPEKLYDHAYVDFFGTQDSRPRYELDVKQGDSIWFVIDTDKWREHGKIGVLRANCHQRCMALKDANYSAWRVAQSNPCFELWLYYHFYAEKPNAMVIGNNSFKEFVHYKLEGGFGSQTMPALIRDAIRNASANYAEDHGEPAEYCTEVFKLGEFILPFVEDVI